MYLDKLSREGVPKNPARHRKALLETLARRFYINEQGVLVSNGLSTELIAFPSDNSRKHGTHVSDKIQHAMHYATAFKDIKEINALKHIAPHGDNKTPDDYVVLGLYLYLEDECSRLGRDKTFLTAMREAGATLAVDDKNFTSSDLLAKTKEALRIVGLEQTHGAMLDSWFQNGNYSINGVLHSGDGTRANLRGAYAILAQNISLQNPKLLGLNMSISYALGNREAVRNTTSQKMYELTQEYIKPGKCEEMTHIRDCIAEGDRIREARIRDEIHNQVLPPSAGYEQQFKTIDKRAKEILGYLPNEVLEVLHHDWYMFAYSDAKDITGCYPVADLPGVTEEENKSAREGKALRQQRYHMIFLSNGDRNIAKDDVSANGTGTNGTSLNGNHAPQPDANEALDEHMKNKIVAQSILHEAMHVIISHLLDEEKEKLKEAVMDMHMEMKRYHRKGEPCGGMLPYFKERLDTINTNTLAEVLDYDSGLYPNYRGKELGKNGKERKPPRDVEAEGFADNDTRWEEVACNVMGLMHTDHPFPPKDDNRNPYADLFSLGQMAGEINKFSENVATACVERNVHQRRSRARAAKEKSGQVAVVG